MDALPVQPIKKRVSVYLDDTSERELKSFHCPACGKTVFQYLSSVKIVLPGEGEFAKAPLVVQCHGAVDIESNGRMTTTRCKTLYFVE